MPRGCLQVLLESTSYTAFWPIARARALQRALRERRRRCPTPSQVHNPASCTHTSSTSTGLVSGQKRRFTEGGFDLDLAYVTPRLIAMALPATGGERLYRNPMSEAARFLRRFHPGGRAKVWSLCGERAYAETRLAPPAAAVVQRRFGFGDHEAPPLALARALCLEAAAWLRAHPANVAVVHCKAGKGRTGLALCCLMLWLHASGDAALACFSPAALEDGSGCEGGGEEATAAAEAAAAALSWRRELQRRLWVDLSSLGADPVAAVLALYGERRARDGRGVTVASQRRWVAHFWRALQEERQQRQQCGGAGGGGRGGDRALAAVRVRRLLVGGLPRGAAAGCLITVAVRDEPRSGAWQGAEGGGNSGDDDSCAAFAPGVRPRTVAVFRAPRARGGSGSGICAAGGCAAAPAVGPVARFSDDGGACDADIQRPDVSVVADPLDPRLEALAVDFPPAGSQPRSQPNSGGGGDGNGKDAAGPVASSAALWAGDARIQIDLGRGGGGGRRRRLAYAWLSARFLPRGDNSGGGGGNGGGGGGAVRLARGELDKVARGAPPALRLDVEYEDARPPLAADATNVNGGGAAAADCSDEEGANLRTT